MVCRQHASAVKVKFTNLTTYSYKYLTIIYSVRLTDKTIDRLIHFTVCAAGTATSKTL